MKVRINIIENEDCNEMIEGITNRTVADSQFCAYETIERKYRGKLQNTTLDTCKGESCCQFNTNLSRTSLTLNLMFSLCSHNFQSDFSCK